MNNFTVYIHHTPNNKVYVGITQKKVFARWGKDGSGYSNQQLFWRAIQKYGWDNIEHEIVAENLSKEEACQMEIDLIAKYKSNNPDYGYNISFGGDVVQLGLTRTEEQRKHISDGHKGIELTDSQINNLNSIHEKLRGVPRSEEVKAKISEANRGKVRTPEMRKRMSDAQKQRTNRRVGYSLSVETKEKLREANLGKVLSEETRQKMSENNSRYWLGKSRSEETKRKISESLKGKPSKVKGIKRSDEFKKKVSDSQKRRLQNVDLSGKNNGFYGKHHSPETIEKIRQASIKRTQLRREAKSQNGSK